MYTLHISAPTYIRGKRAFQGKSYQSKIIAAVYVCEDNLPEWRTKGESLISILFFFHPSSPLPI